MAITCAFTACTGDDALNHIVHDTGEDNGKGTSVFLLIDKASINNRNEPNNFSETDVNDQIAEIGFLAPFNILKIMWVNHSFIYRQGKR